MPIYDLECKKCGNRFEFMKIRSDEVAVCTKCGATGEENLMKEPPKNTGLNFVGPNWAGRGKKGY